MDWFIVGLMFLKFCLVYCRIDVVLIANWFILRLMYEFGLL